MTVQAPGANTSWPVDSTGLTCAYRAQASRQLYKRATYVEAKATRPLQRQLQWLQQLAAPCCKRGPSAQLPCTANVATESLKPWYQHLGATETADVDPDDNEVQRIRRYVATT